MNRYLVWAGGLLCKPDSHELAGFRFFHVFLAIIYGVRVGV